MATIRSIGSRARRASSGSTCTRGRRSRQGVAQLRQGDHLVPTDAELRRKAAELGYPIPPSRRSPTADPDAIRAQARNHMFALLVFSDERAA